MRSTIDKEVINDYLRPVNAAIAANILTIKDRYDRRKPADWKFNDYMMTASAAQQLAKDCEYVINLTEFVRDMEQGAFDAEAGESRA